MPATPFNERTVTFLQELKLHNDREWFQARKTDFQENVQEPMHRLVRWMNEFFQRNAPDYVLPDPLKAMNRIYRDIRFSNDKSPYKTQISAIFTRRGLDKKVGAATYVALSGEEFVVAGGLYFLEGPNLYKVRSHLAEHHPEMTRLLKSSRTKSAFGELKGDQLTRMPKGFPVDHPAEDLIRRKQWLLSQTWPATFALEPQFLKELERRLHALMPFLLLLDRSFEK